ncbi:hypothetical protein Tco_0323956 [Tanacetum coccineum]
MLEKSMYDSWASRIRLFIKGKKNGRMMLNSIDEGPLVYPTVVGEDGQTRPKKYSELTKARTDFIRLTEHADDTQFDKLLPISDETLYEYYWRFSQLINDMHTIGMTMQQVQVNTKYSDPLALVANSQTLYNLSQSLQHSVPSMHPPPQQFTPVYAATNHQQPYHTLVNPIQQLVSLQPYISQSVTQQSQAKFPQLDSSHDVPTFQPGDDPIVFINKAMAFLSAVASRFPPSNNQLRTGIATTSRGNYATGQPRVMKFYNCHGEGHMTEDLDAYDSDCDDISSAKAVLMVNLSSCDSEVLFEVPYSDTYPNDMIN